MEFYYEVSVKQTNFGGQILSVVIIVVIRNRCQSYIILYESYESVSDWSSLL